MFCRTGTPNEAVGPSISQVPLGEEKKLKTFYLFILRLIQNQGWDTEIDCNSGIGYLF